MNDKTSNNVVGQNIKFLRKLRKLTQKELAELVGIHEVQMRSYELNKHMPKTETLVKISEALNVPLSTLFDTDLIYRPIELSKNITQKITLLSEYTVSAEIEALRIKLLEIGIKTKIDNNTITLFRDNSEIQCDVKELELLCEELKKFEIISLSYFINNLFEKATNKGN